MILSPVESRPSGRSGCHRYHEKNEFLHSQEILCETEWCCAHTCAQLLLSSMQFHAAHIRHKEVNFVFVYGCCSIQTYVPDSARVLASVCYEGFSDVVLQGNSSS